MRERRILLALTLASCGGGGVEGSEDGGADVGRDVASCEGLDLVAAIVVEGAAIPGRDLVLSVGDVGSGVAYLDGLVGNAVGRKRQLGHVDAT